ncbi:MAG: hypothetical protein JNL07_09610, partial [Rhodospirillales bacterium]|nr:hypothetical protein [Rhodospirillales bacterium]
MRRTQRARPHRPSSARLIPVLALAGALASCWVAADRAQAQTKTYDVRGPTQNSGGARYEITNPSLADELNRQLTPIIGAYQVCDYATYSRLWKPARDYIADAAKLATPADGRVLMDMWGRMLDPGAAAHEFRQRHCEAVIGADFRYLPMPGKRLDVRVPCLVPLQADGKDINWCDRSVWFWNGHMRDAVKTRIENANAALRGCEGEDKFKREVASLRSAQTSVLSGQYRGAADKYEAAIATEYEKRGRPVFLRQHEETVTTSLAGNYP